MSCFWLSFVWQLAQRKIIETLRYYKTLHALNNNNNRIKIDDEIKEQRMVVCCSWHH